ncbi:MAG: hypothetical protein Q9162_001239 [Coniocarpon cinnabarinum]
MSLSLATVLALLALLQTSLAQAAAGFQVGQAVNTTSGIVIGHRAKNATQVSEYLGIPFAHPPVGDLRFAPPVPYTGDDSINAASFGHDCPSMASSVPGFLQPPSLYNILAQLAQVGDDQQEDCLYINVWSKPQTGSASKPVLVWIYGGGFNIGGTNSSAYSGQFWADTEDVVFVNFNYRLNIFGFPGAPNLEQNVGLLDQRVAIEWVRDNIAAFGGDPSRITIFGQSAGGASVDLYNYAHTEDPIIAGSISQSGTADSFGNLMPSTANDSWYQTAAKVGCGQEDADAVLACMRSPNTTMNSLVQAENSGSGLASVQGIFGPTIDNKTVFYNYIDLAFQNKYIQKPYLFGNNYYEAGLFILLAIGAGENVTMDEWTGFNAGEFTCPESTAAIFRSSSGLPTWRYIYKAEFPNEKLPTSMDEAWHGAEILPMFGSSEEVSQADSTWQERAMGSYMRGAWAAFAHDPANGLNVYGWKQYSNVTDSVIQLGFDNTSSTTFSVFPSYNSTGAYNTLCPTFPYGGAANR